MGYNKISIDHSIEKLHMPENLAINMMVAEQHEKCGKQVAERRIIPQKYL